MVGGVRGGPALGSHIEQLLHELGVGVQVSPGEAAQVRVIQVEQVLGGPRGGAALAVLHHTQPQCTSLAGQQTIWNTRRVKNKRSFPDDEEVQRSIRTGETPPTHL